jgi:RNA recognition motif-containing protein
LGRAERIRGDYPACTRRHEIGARSRRRGKKEERVKSHDRELSFRAVSPLHSLLPPASMDSASPASTSLGKRKARGEGTDADAHGATLFVSNLPYAVTSVDIQTLFSDLAPVRTAFVVTEQGSGVSKGVGYVSFAAREDAAAAYAAIEKDGLAILGRKLRVQWAETKVRARFHCSSCSSTNA